MELKKHIPNAITCLNLVCGCLSVYCTFRYSILWAGGFIFIAAVLDFFDGFAARMLNVKSEIGKQLDSLADVISFGLAPGIIMLKLLELSFIAAPSCGMVCKYMPFIALIIPVFSALRLAKFNIDTRQSDTFIGLATPANALLIASLPFLLSEWGVSDIFPFKAYLFFFVLNPYVLVCYTIIFSYLLVSEVPLFAMKFKNFKWIDNKLIFIFLGISLILILLFYFAAVPIIIFLYIILSMINNFNKKTIS
jgi:CDP-diacylglycerol--serine O-phosphatidyltransferase